jgi:hypothetical protein
MHVILLSVMSVATLLIIGFNDLVDGSRARRGGGEAKGRPEKHAAPAASNLTCHWVVGNTAATDDDSSRLACRWETETRTDCSVIPQGRLDTIRLRRLRAAPGRLSLPQSACRN